MNDITPAHELMGKVIILTGMGELPPACIQCPYFFDGTKGCIATSYCNIENINYNIERMDDCPLRIVGR